MSWALERRRVVAAEHVLVAQEVREHREQCVPHRSVGLVLDRLEQQAQPEQLPFGEHLAVAPVAPAVQTAALVAGRDGIVGNRQLVFDLGEHGCCALDAPEITLIGSFELAALLTGVAVGAVVLDRPQPVPRRSVLGLRVGERGVAARAVDGATRRRAFDMDVRPTLGTGHG